MVFFTQNFQISVLYYCVFRNKFCLPVSNVLANFATLHYSEHILRFLYLICHSLFCALCAFNYLSYMDRNSTHNKVFVIVLIGFDGCVYYLWFLYAFLFCLVLLCQIHNQRQNTNDHLWDDTDMNTVVISPTLNREMFLSYEFMWLIFFAADFLKCSCSLLNRWETNKKSQ